MFFYSGRLLLVNYKQIAPFLYSQNTIFILIQANSILM